MGEKKEKTAIALSAVLCVNQIHVATTKQPSRVTYKRGKNYLSHGFGSSKSKI